MPYRTSRGFDAVKALRNIAKPQFVRALARTASEWDFAAAAPVPMVPIESLVKESRTTFLNFRAGEFGETPLTDLVVLSLLVAQRLPAVIFEFGTFTGLGTMHMALNSPNSVVHTLDLESSERHSISGLDWETQINQTTIGSIYRADQDVATRVNQHWGDSRQFDSTSLRGKVDFIFIDASHSYEFVRSDTQKAIEMAAPGATIVWHDYSRACPDVQRVVSEQVPRFSPVAIAGTSIAMMRLPEER
jgi:predicted O-methyltransferase YrrM